MNKIESRKKLYKITITDKDKERYYFVRSLNARLAIANICSKVEESNSRKLKVVAVLAYEGNDKEKEYDETHKQDNLFDLKE